ncbi:hypothetical protein O6H91_01G144600 [Diphasiastrum complanatum]|uniref:Uncharacterized protein n=1 Tax=Diphasiastrum complanatum TaxID=34168 RepID=A0ACC2EWX9_DIPCM|nr:hypothetical protein O6H91_01G144600 [Diphasiastrum complanatum]
MMSSSSSNSSDTITSAVHSTGSAFSTRVMVCAVIVLFVVLVFIGLLHVYARWFWRYSSAMSSGRWAGRRHRRFHFVISEPTQAPLVSVGLHKSVVDLLPTFVYSRENCKEGLECAVCLCDFEEKEVGRTLPKCSHSFHTACIDLWFISNSTCPLCRIEVDKDASSENKLPIANDELGLSSVALSMPFDANPPFQVENVVFNPQEQFARAAAASSVPSPRLSVSSLSPRTICLTVSDTIPSSERTSLQSNEDDFIREAAASLPRQGIYVNAERQEKIADPALQHFNQTLQPHSAHCPIKSQTTTTRLRAKKAPHVVIEVPKPSANFISACSKPANPSPSPSTCKSPLSHLKSMRWLLGKDRKATPSGSSITDMNGAILQVSCRTLESASTFQTPSKLHRSLPSSPSD